MSVREVVTLASLIEKETRRAEEKPLVSAVFHNRLGIGMKLDCDPTIIYALKQAGPFDGRLRSKDLQAISPYNTYLHAGLPPGPICNPGRASLEAALESGDDRLPLFRRPERRQPPFSRTLREHTVRRQQIPPLVSRLISSYTRFPRRDTSRGESSSPLGASLTP